ncbi:MAG: hypothetical protein JNM51_15890 [Bacteroidia bacterium]|nr:hypothetical protein [Bacteroidia bacterium]
MEYFYLKGIKDEGVIGDCRNELKKAGHIIYYTLPSYGIKESLTDIGLKFIVNGGYDGKI